MFNAVKMDLCRMFKTKSLYVIWLIMIFVTVFTTYLTKLDRDAVEQSQYEQAADAPEENMNLGMSVSIPTQPGDKVTVLDVVFGNIQGKAIAIYIVIFAVLFSTADMNSGYIKNIGGQLRHRYLLIFSKVIALLVHTILTFALFTAVQAISNGIFLGYIKMGDMDVFLRYLGVQLCLHFAFALICMAIAVLLRNNVFSMILVICMCMNVLMIFYNFVDKMVAKIGFEDFHLLKYTITGKISLLPMEFTAHEGMMALAIAGGFIIAMAVVTGTVFEKRDII